MDIASLERDIRSHHEAFVRLIHSMPVDLLERTPNGKWSTGQHLEHIRMSVRPVALALSVPRWFLRWRFGSPNRPPRTYDALVQRYKEKLSAGGRAPSRFVPRMVRAAEIHIAAAAMSRAVDDLCKRVRRWQEADLDHYLLPHPLLGKLTIREMLFFTIHHVQHHMALVQRDHFSS